MRKNTKSALLLSVVSIIICCTMLLGTTMAWFTDSVTSSVNTIVAGNLDMKLEWSTDYTTWSEVDATTNIFKENALWEPGYTEVVYLKVSNVGTLDFKTAIDLTVASEVKGTNVAGDEFALSDYIYYDVVEVNAKYADRAAVEAAMTNKTTLADGYNATDIMLYDAKETDKVNSVIYALIAYMPTSVGNEANYRGEKVPTITIGLEALAAQLTSEIDSFDNQYDKDADYAVEVSTAEGLIAALANGGNIKLAGDIAVTELLEVNSGATVTLNLNGNTLTGDIIAPNANLTITNGIIVDTTAANSAIEINAGTLVLDGVNITSNRHPIRIDGAVTATINGGTYRVTGEEAMTTHALNVSGAANVTVNGGTFIGIKGTPNGNAMGGAAVNVQAGATVIINGGNFSGGVNHTLASNGTLIVYGGTFDQDPSNYVASGYEVIGNADGNYTVSAKISADNEALNAAIAAGDTTVTLADGNYIIPDSAQGKTLTIIGNGNTTVAVQDDGSYEGCDYSLLGSTVTFENITITTDSSTYTGYARLNATYNNCTINGTYTLYGDSTFNNCTFNVSGDAYNIWTWGAPNATFNNCTFNSSGKSLLLYGGTNTKLVVNNCVFNDDNAYADVNNKAAIEVGTDWSTDTKEIIVTDTTVNGFDVTDKGINTGSTLWGNKNSMGTDKLNVVIDGADVY